MTFRDKFQHLTILQVYFLCTACWAPEVEPPTPKLSPAEIAGLSIATASASSLDSTEMRPIPSQAKETLKPQQNKRVSVEVKDKTSTIEVREDDSIDANAFPYQATLDGDEVPLLGHGGGTILTLGKEELISATIEVLEEKNGKVRVLCRGCSSSHPYQAGWISTDYIRPNN